MLTESGQGRAKVGGVAWPHSVGPGGLVLPLSVRPGGRAGAQGSGRRRKAGTCSAGWGHPLHCWAADRAFASTENLETGFNYCSIRGNN